MRAIALAALAAATFAAATFAAVPLQAQDATGTWEIAYNTETPRGSMERTLVVHLTQDGTVLAGQMDGNTMTGSVSNP